MSERKEIPKESLRPCGPGVRHYRGMILSNDPGVPVPAPPDKIAKILREGGRTGTWYPSAPRLN